MMNKKKVFLFFILAISLNNLFAQNIVNKDYKFQVAFVPQYLIAHGIRMDFEYHLKPNKHILLFSPQFYYDKNRADYGSSAYYEEDHYDLLKGYGIGLHHKIVIHTLNNNTWQIYFAYGGEYARFNIDFQNWEWVKYTEDGLEYIKYDLVDVKQNINRYRFDTYLGFQYNYAQVLFIDFYLGLGGIYSDSSMNPAYATAKFEFKMYDYAFTGLYLPIGFRFGFRF